MVFSDTEISPAQDHNTEEPNANPDTDRFAELVSSMHLNDEDILLRNDDGMEEGEVMDQDDDIDNFLNATAESFGHTQETSETVAQQTDNDVLCETIKPEEIALVDIQMVYHRGRGSLIKELAYKPWNSSNIYTVNLKHDVTDVPSHLVVKNEGCYYDLFTGMDLETGEYPYDDRCIANLLNGARMVFLKGSKKKSVLASVYKRLNSKGTRDGNNNDTHTYRQPIIINVDGHTADDEDRAICKKNKMAMALFSFPFVYTHMHVYIKMLYGMPGTLPPNPMDIVYVTNVLSKNPSYNFSGRGRIVCICHNDHSRGETIEASNVKPRCALFNLSILENLWFRGNDTLFRRLVKAERDEELQKKKIQLQTQQQQKPYQYYARQKEHEKRLAQEYRQPRPMLKTQRLYQQQYHQPSSRRDNRFEEKRSRWQEETAEASPNARYAYRGTRKYTEGKQLQTESNYDYSINEIPNQQYNTLPNDRNHMSFERCLKNYTPYDEQQDFVRAIRNTEQRRQRRKNAREQRYSRSKGANYNQLV